jgi:hypothetical protein
VRGSVEAVVDAAIFIPMKRVGGLVAVLLLVAGVIAGCTPKPVSAEPVAEEFLAAFAARDTDTVAELVDQPESALKVMTQSYDGLQAESMSAELTGVSQDGTQATADYRLNWELPRDRSLAYDTQMVLTQTSGEWTVRWQPTVVHPQIGANQHLELRAVPAMKASVVSSDGAELMAPGSMYRVLVDTEVMRDPEETAEAIARAVNAAHDRDETVPTIDAAALTEDLSAASGTHSVVMVNAVEGPAVEADLAGRREVFLNEEAAMVSTDPGFAPDIMARIGPLVADDLEGDAGWKVSAVNDNGAVIGELVYHEPHPEPAVQVSLDRDAQVAAEQSLSQLPQDMEAMLVAIRPSTGQVLAVAQTEAADRAGDLALMGQYPPGSIFKVITAASGVQQLGMDADMIVGCPGTQNIYGRVVTNFNGFALGNVPLDNAFAQSCNTTFADMSTQLEPGQLQDMGKAFGLGVDYDIPGLNTATGAVPEGEVPLERTEAGYGQGLTLSSPFGAALMSATAAAGTRPVPYLIEGHETKVSEDVPSPAPETIDQVQRMMRSVVASGTAAGMTASGDIHGKTGEAEVNDGSHAWFTGYRDDLAFASLVVYGGGSTVAVNAADRFLNTLDELKAGPQIAPAQEPAA